MYGPAHSLYIILPRYAIFDKKSGEKLKNLVRGPIELVAVSDVGPRGELGRCGARAVDFGG